MQKRLIFILSVLAFLCSSSASAQICDNGAFAAPVLKLTRLTGNTALITGGRVGWIINKRLAIGAGYYALANDVSSGYTVSPGSQDLLIEFNYAGLEFEYLILYESTYNFGINMLLGSGGLNFYLNNSNTKFSNRNLLVWEPQLCFEFKINEWIHADAGLSYRMISSYIELYGVTANDLQGMAAVFTLKLGAY